MPSVTPLPLPYQALFDHWLQRRQQQGVLRQASSVAVYRSMWQAFAHWCVGEQVSPRQIDAAVLDRFLRSRAEAEGLTDRHAWRWLSLIDAILRPGLSADAPMRPASGARATRIPDADVEVPGSSDPQVDTNTASLPLTGGQAPGLPDIPPNRAASELLESRPAWRYANASDQDPLPDHLDAAQARRLVDWLMATDNGYSAPGARAGSWQALRNRSAVALQLGAGLAPGDVRAALQTGVRASSAQPGRPERIRIPKHGAVDERDVPLAPWAARLLQLWLARRAEEAIPGEFLFPGMRRGSAWSKVSQFEAAATVLEAAGLADAGRGSFVLRHTFALRQLRRGHPPDEVARWLGVSDPAVMARYQRVVYDPVDLA